MHFRYASLCVPNKFRLCYSIRFNAVNPLCVFGCHFYCILCSVAMEHKNCIGLEFCWLVSRNKSSTILYTLSTVAFRTPFSKCLVDDEFYTCFVATNKYSFKVTHIHEQIYLKKRNLLKKGPTT